MNTWARHDIRSNTLFKEESLSKSPYSKKPTSEGRRSVVEPALIFLGVKVRPIGITLDLGSSGIIQWRGAAMYAYGERRIRRETYA